VLIFRLMLKAYIVHYESWQGG